MASLVSSFSLFRANIVASYVVKDTCLISTPYAHILPSQLFQNLNFKNDFNLLSFQAPWLSLITITLMDIPVSHIIIPPRLLQYIG